MPLRWHRGHPGHPHPAPVPETFVIEVTSDGSFGELEVLFAGIATDTSAGRPPALAMRLHDYGIRNSVRRLQMAREPVDLVPQRLRVDDEARTTHHAALPIERQVVDVLVDRDIDREVHRVPATLDASTHASHPLNAEPTGFKLVDTFRPRNRRPLLRQSSAARTKPYASPFSRGRASTFPAFPTRSIRSCSRSPTRRVRKSPVAAVRRVPNLSRRRPGSKSRFSTTSRRRFQLQTTCIPSRSRELSRERAKKRVPSNGTCSCAPSWRDRNQDEQVEEHTLGVIGAGAHRFGLGVRAVGFGTRHASRKR